MYHITIPGRAVPAVRMTQRSKFANPAAGRYLEYKTQIGYRANQVVKEPIMGRVGVTMTFIFNDKRRRDIDNLIKSVLDGLNGIAYIDDSQVATVTADKAVMPKTTPEGTHVVVYKLSN